MKTTTTRGWITEVSVRKRHENVVTGLFQFERLRSPHVNVPVVSYLQSAAASQTTLTSFVVNMRTLIRLRLFSLTSLFSVGLGSFVPCPAV